MHNIADAEIMVIEPALCAQGFPEKWAESLFHLTINRCKVPCIL